MSACTYCKGRGFVSSNVPGSQPICPHCGGLKTEPTPSTPGAADPATPREMLEAILTVCERTRNAVPTAYAYAPRVYQSGITAVEAFVMKMVRALDSRPSRPAERSEAEPTYPCTECGKPRTKAEGGATFTVCDACWEKSKAPTAEPQGAREAEDIKEAKVVILNLCSALEAHMEKGSYRPKGAEHRAYDNACRWLAGAPVDPPSQEGART